MLSTWSRNCLLYLAQMGATVQTRSTLSRNFYSTIYFVRIFRNLRGVEIVFLFNVMILTGVSNLQRVEIKFYLI